MATDRASTGFRTSAACLAAQNFTMPALSPTMTEGNISSWRVKEGDSFSAGDVLLEIETDKASMDVEAQDDGILAKIIQPDGAKGIQVGTRIGVIAEPGDNLSSLEIPKEEASATPPKKEASSSSTSEEPESQQEAPPTSKPTDSTPTPTDRSSKPKPGKSKKQTYPLLPSVEHLMQENGLDASAVDKMTPSGPNGRLLKGDVLAYLGSVSASYPTELSAKIGKLSHLDLSNIKIATPPPAPKAAAASIPEPQLMTENLEVAVSISMAPMIEVQKRIQSTLGVVIPLSTFIARATDVANDDLPRSALAKQSADELFNQILGLDKVSSSGVRGNFMPQITAIPPTDLATMPRVASSRKADIIDLLTSKKTASRPKSTLASPLPGIAATTNIFSVSVPKGDEKRARVFLERMKSVLEEEPGRLVL
jgi:pyruvate/2-oxoglutarate dehydrogenase complex dihydrolipoamide acyltransferase (E2) component